VWGVTVLVPSSSPDTTHGVIIKSPTTPDREEERNGSHPVKNRKPFDVWL
jgi:hypothetical protein